MHFNTVDLENNTIQPGYVIHHNGVNSLLGLTHNEHVGGPNQIFSDLNNLGQLPVLRYNSVDPGMEWAMALG